MPVPALGTPVIWHSPNGYPIVGLVAATEDTWNQSATDTADRAGTGVVAPPPGQVHLLLADPAAQNVWTSGPFSEGTATGQWSYAP